MTAPGIFPIGDMEPSIFLMSFFLMQQPFIISEPPFSGKGVSGMKRSTCFGVLF